MEAGGSHREGLPRAALREMAAAVSAFILPPSSFILPGSSPSPASATGRRRARGRRRNESRRPPPCRNASPPRGSPTAPPHDGKRPARGPPRRSADDAPPERHVHANRSSRLPPGSNSSRRTTSAAAPIFAARICAVCRQRAIGLAAISVGARPPPANLATMRAKRFRPSALSGRSESSGHSGSPKCPAQAWRTMNRSITSSSKSSGRRCPSGPGPRQFLA